jgi:hypothetical protein
MVPLKEILQDRFGIGFPIGEGSTERDDPLVITDERDYVSIEYAIAEFLLREMGFEYKFEQQRISNTNGRAIDELVYAAKEPRDLEWTQTQRFFFDITAGFKRISTPSEPQFPSLPSGCVLRKPRRHSPPEPSHIGHNSLVILRWIAFLPLAFFASWLATRFWMLFRFNQFQQYNNSYVVLFFIQAGSGAVLGWVGVKIAPGAKSLALICCALVSALISTMYFLRFNDLLGGFAATTGFIATIIAGYLARDDE